MNQDQTAPKGAVWSAFIVFASVISLECIYIYAADIISRQHFLDKNSSRIRVILTHLAYRVNGKKNLINQTIIHSFESMRKERAS